MEKKLIGGILFIVFFLTTVSFYALDGALTDEQSKNTYVSNEIIVKLKGSAARNLQTQLLGQTQSINMTTASPGASLITTELDAVLREHGVVSVKPLAEGFYQRMRTTGQTAEQLRQGVMETHMSTASRTVDSTSFTIEDLFVLTTENETHLHDLINTLNTLDDVAYAEPNMRYTINAIPNDPFYSSTGSWGQTFDDLWGLKTIESEKVWDVSKGEGIVVAVVDTGINYTHEDIRDNMWINTGEIAGNGIDDDGNGYIDDIHGYDFHSYDYDPTDDVGHGTHCAGTIAATGNNGLGVIGVAPAAKLMAVRGLGPDGGYTDDLVKCLYYAVENGADILSNSWGGEGKSQALQEVFDYATSLGIVAVVAAGNSNDNAVSYSPANIDSVITVAALNPDGDPASFSNFGDDVDVAAPGVDILSTMPDNSAIARSNPDLKVAPGYYRLRGTSMACPHVAGLAAILMSHYKKENYDNYSEAIKTMITDSATPFAQAPQSYYGKGIINAQNALNVPQVSDVIVKDYTFTEVEGNGNGIIESNEKVAVTLILKNRGLKAVTGAKVVLSTDSLYLKNIVLNQITPGTIKQGETIDSSTTPFILETKIIPGNLRKDEIKAHMTVEITGDEAYQNTENFNIALGVQCVTRTAMGAIYDIEMSDEYIAWTRTVYNTGASILYIYDRKTGETKMFSGLVHRYFDILDDKIILGIAPQDTAEYEIHCYFIKTDKLVKLTEDTGSRSTPVVDGDHIVWQEGRNAKTDLYLYTVSTGVTKRLTYTANMSESFYVIKGNKMAWKAGKNIYTYDIPTGKTRILPLAAVGPSEWYETDAVSENLVAYRHVEETRYGTFYTAYIYNMVTGENTRLDELINLYGNADTQIVDIIDNTILFSYLIRGESKDNHYHTYNIDTGEVKQVTGIIGNYLMKVHKNEISWLKTTEHAIYVASLDIENKKETLNLSLLPDTKIYSSSQFSAQFSKENAVDGNDTTVWGSAPVTQDAHPFIYLDLSKSYELTRLVIKFYKGFHASSFIIGVSNDMKKWTTTTMTGQEIVDLDIAALQLRSRYVGIQCLEGPGGAYGIKEFEVWGNRVITTPIPPTPTPAGVPVPINDAGLEKALRYSLNKPAGTIYTSELESMKAFYGPKCGISNIDPLRHCINMQYADLSNNPLGDNINALTGLIRLQYLSLASCNITNIAPLSTTINLYDLNLNYNAITDLSPVKNLGRLYNLLACDNRISNISFIAEMKSRLNCLGLNDNEISDLSPLASVKGIPIYLLSGNNIKDISVFSTEDKKITFLVITHNNMVIKEDGGQGTKNLDTINYLRMRPVYIDYVDGNITK